MPCVQAHTPPFEQYDVDTIILSVQVRRIHHHLVYVLLYVNVDVAVISPPFVYVLYIKSHIKIHER